MKILRPFLIDVEAPGRFVDREMIAHGEDSPFRARKAQGLLPEVVIFKSCFPIQHFDR
jgi:hypothetical protein